MAYFANFTGKLSHGVYKMAPNNFNLAWSADKVGAMRNQVYVMGRFDLEPRRGVRRRRQRRRRRVLHRAAEQHLGHHARHSSTAPAASTRRSRCPTRTAPTPTSSPPPIPASRTGSTPTACNEGILTLRMAEFGGDGPTEDLGARGRVVEARRPRGRGADAAPGVRAGAGEPNSPTAARRICAAYPKGRSDMARWLITGCSTGIGREIARAALEAGHSVVVTARTHRDDRRLRRRLRRPRGRPSHSTSPTRTRSPRRSRRPTTRSAASTCWSTTPATATCRRSRRVRTTKVRKLFDTNYFGVVDTIKAVLPAMRARKSGHIVNISSMTGLVANPPNAYYSSTKFALEALTEALAQEVKPLGIKVTAIEPGAFRTDWAARSMWESSTPIGDYDENVGARKTHDQGVRQPPARRSAQGGRGRADGDHARRAAAAPAARPRRAQGGARQARRVLRVDRRVGSRHQGRQLPEGADDGHPRRQGRLHHRRRPRDGSGARGQARQRGCRRHRRRRLRGVRLHRLPGRHRRGPGRDGETGRGPGSSDPGAPGRRSRPRSGGRRGRRRRSRSSAGSTSSSPTRASSG